MILSKQYQALATLFAAVFLFDSTARSEVSVKLEADFAQVFITGRITSKDVDAVNRAASRLDEKISVRVVFLSSVGGDVEAAMAIGRVVRDKMFWTTVKGGSKCASACVLIFAAGVFRDAAGEGTVVGIHRPTFEPNYFAGLSVESARAKYLQMAQKVRLYLSEMGMSDRLFEQMMNVASNEI
jgi:hypothetical protein